MTMRKTRDALSSTYSEEGGMSDCSFPLMVCPTGSIQKAD